MPEKVVVTGMGVVSPLGNDLDSFWEAMCAGRSGIRAVDDFDVSDLPAKIGGRVAPVAPEGLEPKEIRRQDRYTLYALEAANQAWRQSGLDMSMEDPFDCGVMVGSGIGGLDAIYENCVAMHERGPRRVSPLFVPKGLVNMAAGLIAIHLGLRGPNKAVVTACATATHCIGDAADTIRMGKAKVMLAGGSEAGVSRFGLAGFCSMRALSTRNEPAEAASRPFDADRDGFVMGDGAGILVLESESHAKARGAEILAEAAGMGDTCDAHHITAPLEDGAGAVQAMRLALAQAEARPEEVSYYNAHGTSTKLNDAMESRALATVFGLDTMPLVSSTKSMTGHLLGAAGAIEAIACIQAIRTGVAPPNINYDTPDPECRVNVVANTAREADIAIAMSNSLGFGGHNASILFRRHA